MIPVDSLFEAHLTVSDLDRAIAFYRDVVGLRLAHVVSARQAAFFWIGAEGNAMLGLWGTGSGPQRMALHIAFRASLADVLDAPRALRSAGITPLDFDGRPTDEPVVFAWMAAASVFFRDPDDHLLEYISMLPHEPLPERGVVPWRVWEALHRADTPASSLSPIVKTPR
ncbi:MAG TPA: VOC family protein [Vicinamibacterales bacterium]|jgi:lactoylglutathione lyase|nr:VOC family protein [Vicinamibacterales bacterium]